MNKDPLTFKRFSIFLIWIWLSIFALAPTLLVLVTSLLEPSDAEFVHLQLSIGSYLQLFNTIYIKVFLHSFYLAGVCTFICLILAYPFAYILSRLQGQYKNLLLFLVIIPFWTSSLIRSYAIMAILKTKGVLNTVLLKWGILHAPLHILYSDMAVIIGLVYSLLPFMILPLYANIEKLDGRILDAARDLGANRWQVFWKIILPLTWPGICTGIILVFLPAMTMFYIPDLLGGAKSLLLGNLIQNQFLAARNWPLGAAVSMALTLLMSVMLWIYWRMRLHNQSQYHLL